jgi:hypothetical protein
MIGDMFEDDERRESFEETVRSIARELGRSVERAVDKVDLDEIADSIGVDPGLAKDWVESAGGWLRAQAEGVGDEVSRRISEPRRTPPPSEDPLQSAGPHPLDLPTEEQGLALAALESGRWTVEPGSNALASAGEGPRPRDTLGIVRELRVRDWIAADGRVTLVGSHALSRWVAAGAHR